MTSQPTVLEKCDLCESVGSFVLLAREDSVNDLLLGQLGVSNKQNTVLCKLCGWVFKTLVLTSDQLMQLYEQVGGYSTYNDADKLAIAEKANRLYVEIAEYIVNPNSNLPILDVGGGVGQASLAFAQKGFEVDVLDLASSSPLHPRMRFHRGGIDTVPHRAHYGLAILSHVLEHVWSPKKMLTDVHSLLAPGGVVFVEVPFELYTPIVLRKTGDSAHVGYFTAQSLKAFLHLAGFRNIRVSLCLESYGRRKVVVYRGMGTKSNEALARDASTPELRVGWSHVIKSLLSIRQIWLTILSRL